MSSLEEEDKKSFLEEDRESFSKYLKEHSFRLIDEKKHDLFVGYLRHDQEPQGQDRNSAKTQKTWILKNFSWSENNACLMNNNGNKVVVIERNIYKVVTSEHLGMDHMREDLFQRISLKYYGVPRDIVRYLVKLCRTCYPRCSDSGQPTIGNDVNGIDGIDNMSQRNAVHVVVEWLKYMKDRDWPETLECSRYRDIISGLYTILKTARPADAYFEGIKAQAEVYSSYTSADLLTMPHDEAGNN